MSISADIDFYARGKTLDGQNLSGQLSDWTVNELLQIMQVTKKTGALKIEGDRRGRILFRDGVVTGADLTGSRQTYLAEDRKSVADVLYVLSSLDKGTFAVSSADVPEVDGWSVEEILSDVDGLGRLEAAVDEAGLIEAPGVRVADKLEGMIQLEPDDWQVIAALVQPFTFSHLEGRFGRGGAVRALHTLLRLDVAEAVSPEDETQFLDRLAEGLSGDSAEPTWLESSGKHEADSLPVVDTQPVPIEPEPEPEPVEPQPVVSAEPEPEVVEQPEAVEEPEPEPEPKPKRQPVPVQGVAADASTTLTDGVYDEIRRLRSKAAEK